MQAWRSPFVIKSLALGVLLWINAFAFYWWRLRAMAEELTYWTLWVTTTFCLISMKCSLDMNINKKRGWLFAHHVLFETIAPLNILVTSVYWATLREPTLKRFEGQPLLTRASAWVHTAPILACFAYFSVTDIVIKAKHGLVLSPIALAYGYHNYTTVKAKGKPVYWFLTWEDSQSFINFGCLFLATLTIFFTLVMITRVIKKTKSNTWKSASIFAEDKKTTKSKQK